MVPREAVALDGAPEEYRSDDWDDNRAETGGVGSADAVVVEENVEGRVKDVGGSDACILALLMREAVDKTASPAWPWTAEAERARHVIHHDTSDVVVVVEEEAHLSMESHRHQGPGSRPFLHRMSSDDGHEKMVSCFSIRSLPTGETQQ